MVVEMKQPFEKVVTEHSATVLRVCRAIVGPTDADDAWSETFLAAMRAYPELPADAKVEAWLVTIASRKAIDLVRARRRRATPVDELPEKPSGEIAVTSASDVWMHVKDLSDKQRQVIAYHYLAGLPYADIAEILGGSSDAARRAASDGIATLRRHLTEAGSEGDTR
jgi:RNA polymerase sigma factor (sigma-70 family)